KELTNAACCNLSESFDRNASVDVNFTDAVSGTKQIQMLGLDGIYTQILYENLPFVRGLSASHGLTYIPGPWVEAIFVTKGTGSVVNGYESITGQIQIEMLEPDKADRFYINGYANGENRFELNAHHAKKISDNLSTLTFGHASRNNLFGDGIDRNKDGFMDIPMAEQYNFFNRWNYRIKNKAEGQFGFRVLMENKTGGQLHGEKDGTSSNHYGIEINTKQFETFTKNGLLFPSKPWKSIAIMTTERYHKVEAIFGLKKFEGEQKSLYVNTIWADILDHTFHKIKFGGSFVLDHFDEVLFDGAAAIGDSLLSKKEIVPGGYVEYTYNNDTNLSMVAGLRTDFLDDLGLMVNPRLHLKYNTSKESSFRLSGGRGMRTPHIFVENSSLFASSRQIIIAEDLQPEIAWNYGMTFSYCFKSFGKEATFNVDFFRTDFENQVVVDMEDVDKVQCYNLKGISYSNSLQTECSISPIERLDIKLAYKYYDVKTTYQGKLLDKPLVPKDRILFNIDYATNREKWKFNFTAKWFGQSRLPNTSGNDPEFQLAEKSPSYYTFMGQITKRFMQFEFYLGGENLLNYRIENPIIDPANPYGTNFDATIIWGPINGRVIYGGFRYKII
ncbi:MAG: TonB-dependent receptor, partial [Bacteroidetes bacterium]